MQPSTQGIKSILTDVVFCPFFFSTRRAVKLASKLGSVLGAKSGGLRLADEEILADALHVAQGSVTPLAAANDKYTSFFFIYI